MEGGLLTGRLIPRSSPNRGRAPNLVFSMTRFLVMRPLFLVREINSTDTEDGNSSGGGPRFFVRRFVGGSIRGATNADHCPTSQSSHPLGLNTGHPATHGLYHKYYSLSSIDVLDLS